MLRLMTLLLGCYTGWSHQVPNYGKKPSRKYVWNRAFWWRTIRRAFKLYAEKMELVTRHWSGKHVRVVQGIDLITLLWTEGNRHIPLDYRFYEKLVDGATKNDHFRSMLETAKSRGFAPECVVFDSWYSSLDNLKLIRRCEWTLVDTA